MRFVRSASPLSDSDIAGEPHKGRELIESLLHPHQPQRELWMGNSNFVLERDELAHVLHDQVEPRESSNSGECLGVGGVQRHAKLVEAGVDQLPLDVPIDHRCVRVEQNVDSAIFEITNQLRQFFVDERLTYAVKDRLLQVRNLVHNHLHLFESEIRGPLDRGERARAMPAEKIAAIGCLQVETDRRLRHDRPEQFHLLEVRFLSIGCGNHSARVYLARPDRSKRMATNREWVLMRSDSPGM